MRIAVERLFHDIRIFSRIAKVLCTEQSVLLSVTHFESSSHKSNPYYFPLIYRRNYFTLSNSFTIASSGAFVQRLTTTINIAETINAGNNS